jgi:hypothetical protein
MTRHSAEHRVLDVHNRETQSRPRFAITVKRKDGLVMWCSLRALTGSRWVDAGRGGGGAGGRTSSHKEVDTVLRKDLPLSH